MSSKQIAHVCCPAVAEESEALAVVKGGVALPACWRQAATSGLLDMVEGASYRNNSLGTGGTASTGGFFFFRRNIVYGLGCFRRRTEKMLLTVRVAAASVFTDGS